MTRYFSISQRVPFVEEVKPPSPVPVLDFDDYQRDGDKNFLFNILGPPEPIQSAVPMFTQTGIRGELLTCGVYTAEIYYPDTGEIEDLILPMIPGDNRAFRIFEGGLDVRYSYGPRGERCIVRQVRETRPFEEFKYLARCKTWETPEQVAYRAIHGPHALCPTCDFILIFPVKLSRILGTYGLAHYLIENWSSVRISQEERPCDCGYNMYKKLHDLVVRIRDGSKECVTKRTT